MLHTTCEYMMRTGDTRNLAAVIEFVNMVKSKPGIHPEIYNGFLRWAADKTEGKFAGTMIVRFDNRFIFSASPENIQTARDAITQFGHLIELPETTWPQFAEAITSVYDNEQAHTVAEVIKVF